MHLDTHVVVRLNEGDPGFFPVVARRLLDSEPLLISPMVRLETKDRRIRRHLDRARWDGTAVHG